MQTPKDNMPVRALYSFPNKLGAQRICYTAWQQVKGLAAAGAQVLVYTGGLLRPVPESVEVRTTLARGKLRIPYKLIGNQRAMALHDAIVASQIERLSGKIDIVHVWPQGALRTIEAAKRFGIPTVLERCNTHTRYAYEVVRDECHRLGVALPPISSRGRSWIADLSCAGWRGICTASTRRSTTPATSSGPPKRG